jgi:hypothetical protein
MSGEQETPGELHSERERYRKTIRLRTPEGEAATVIVTRQGSGGAGRVWLTFQGAIKTTVTMDGGEAEEIIGMIQGAQHAR